MKGFINKSILVLLILSLLLPLGLRAQKKSKEGEKEKPAHIFTLDTEVKRTPVKDQFKTGTCWDFATLSFFESELLRQGKGEFDFSEMFIVRHTYPLKAMNYVRLQGAANFSQGGQSHDVMEMIRRYGLVPENVYPGMNIGENRHNHGEMAAVLKGMLDGVLRNQGSKLTPRWPEAFEAVLDVYLGKPPAQFEYKGKMYTPKSFFDEVIQLNLDDYVELTSYSHHPFYKKCRLEIPDNWMFFTAYYNLPLDELEAVMDYALHKGYSVAWDGDVSEREFSSKTGYAVIPAKDWEDKTQAEQEAKIAESEVEKEITQELRQKTFNNFTTTDDHLMHIVGLAHDQKGTKFYLTKNSSGTDKKYEGYVYLSRSYVRLKTVVILVHKDALPLEISQKLNLR